MSIHREKMAEFATLGGTVHSFPQFSVTVAILPYDNSVKRSNMVLIATAHCNPSDDWCDDTGAEIALNRMLDGAAMMLRSEGLPHSMIAERLVEMFN